MEDVGDIDDIGDTSHQDLWLEQDPEPYGIHLLSPSSFSTSSSSFASTLCITTATAPHSPPPRKNPDDEPTKTTTDLHYDSLKHEIHEAFLRAIVYGVMEEWRRRIVERVRFVVLALVMIMGERIGKVEEMGKARGGKGRL
ncbi:MAG: hypothetical protein L6R37_007519 [Teloschistes peruensis]|nr:MAG: hypothetical protein L6R37_007519 [Teloschistes peruensis]